MLLLSYHYFPSGLKLTSYSW